LKRLSFVPPARREVSQALIKAIEGIRFRSGLKTEALFSLFFLLQTKEVKFDEPGPPILETKTAKKMLPTSMVFRIAKTVSIAAIALMAVIIVIGNTTDYWT